MGPQPEIPYHYYDDDDLDYNGVQGQEVEEGEEGVEVDRFEGELEENREGSGYAEETSASHERLSKFSLAVKWLWDAGHAILDKPSSTLSLAARWLRDAGKAMLKMLGTSSRH